MHKWFEGTVISIDDGIIVARGDDGKDVAFDMADGEGGEELQPGDPLTVWLVKDAEVN